MCMHIHGKWLDLNLTSLSKENNFANISTERSSHHQGISEVFKVNTTIHKCNHTLLWIHVIGGKRSVRVALQELLMIPSEEGFNREGRLKSLVAGPL